GFIISVTPSALIVFKPERGRDNGRQEEQPGGQKCSPNKKICVMFALWRGIIYDLEMMNRADAGGWTRARTTVNRVSIKNWFHYLNTAINVITGIELMA
ncbi:hypothetical protein DNTS_000345, partial [Danionella cerebrum]